MKCPNCGADIPDNSKRCEYCDSQISLEMQKEQEQLNKAGCPKCGSTNIKYKRENKGEIKGKNATAIVHATVGVCQDCGYTWEIKEESNQPKKRKTWLWVLGWIFIFPVPLTILMLRNKKLKPVLRYIIIAAAWIVYLAIAIGSNSGNSSDTDEGAKTQTETEAAQDDKEGTETNTNISEENKAKGASYEIAEGKVVTYMDSIGTVWVQICVPVTNNGSTDLFLSTATLDLEDMNSTLVDSISLVNAYPQIIHPGETAYYYEETTLEGFTETTELKVVPHAEIKESNIECIRYSISDVSLNNSDFGNIEMIGRVTNETDKDGSLVYIVAHLFDENDIMIGQMFTILDNDLAASEQISFKMSEFSLPDTVTTESVSRFEVYAFPFQYMF